MEPLEEIINREPPEKPLPGVKANLSYPANRRSFFAIKYIRRLGQDAYANRIGTAACWLLTQIVLMEDKAGYSRPVDFFNGQLNEKCGFASDHTLIAARDKCVAHGLLFYEPSLKRKAGLYWVIVPPQWEPFDGCDFPAENALQKLQSNGRESFIDRAEQREGILHTSLPIPKPVSTPTPTSLGPVVVENEISGLEQRIRVLGVTRFQGVIHEALRKGSSIAQITAVIDHFEQRPGFWNAGAIRYRLTIPEAPTLASDQGWPKADQTAVSRYRAKLAVTRDRQQIQAGAQSSADNKARDEQLLLRFNDRMSAMTTAEIEQMAADDLSLRQSLKLFGAGSRTFKLMLANRLSQVAEPPR